MLSDALSSLLEHGSLYGPVVDGQGRVVGVLSVDIISDFLASEEAKALAAGPTQRAEI